MDKILYITIYTPNRFAPIQTVYTTHSGPHDPHADPHGDHADEGRERTAAECTAKHMQWKLGMNHLQRIMYMMLEKS